MYQHRYIVYCRSNGNEPEKQLETDKERYPGSCMCGFICWIHEMWSDFYKNAKLDSKLPKTEEIHIKFDKFIDEKIKNKRDKKYYIKYTHIKIGVYNV